MSEQTTVRVDRELSLLLSYLSMDWDMTKNEVIEYLIKKADLVDLTKIRSYEMITQIEIEEEENNE